ncbi:MAG: hypothetical protein J6R84_07810 [Alistipes sp.]|nr:hypothetical protein [Alistipes sp.]
MKLLKRLFLLSVVASVAASCSTGFYSSTGNGYDDLYAMHDRTAIAARQKAEAEARKAEAEARKAEYEAQLAQLQAMVAEAEQKASTRTDSDGVIIVDEGASYNSYNNYVADDYESAYARRLLGFRSANYRMPSSYYDLRYGTASHYVTAYDPAFYNVMVSGSHVWVEPKYITSMFGTWGAVNVTMAVNSPWYFGFGTGFYDPFYYSSWGFPRYSWYDWNWNICYGYGGMNLWWGWGGMYRPWHYHHYPHYHSHHIHIGGPHYGIHLGGGGGYWNRGGSYYGSRNNNTRFDGAGGRTPSRGNSVVNRTSGRSTPYRSPNSGVTYGDSSRSNGSAVKNNQSQTQPSRTGSIGRNNNTARQSVGQSTSTTSRQNSYQNNSSQNRQNYNQGSQGRSSSFSSGSSFGGSSSSGSRSGGMSGGMGGGSRSSGSRGR